MFRRYSEARTQSSHHEIRDHVPSIAYPIFDFRRACQEKKFEISTAANAARIPSFASPSCLGWRSSSAGNRRFALKPPQGCTVQPPDFTGFAPFPSRSPDPDSDSDSDSHTYSIQGPLVTYRWLLCARSPMHSPGVVTRHGPRIYPVTQFPALQLFLHGIVAPFSTVMCGPREGSEEATPASPADLRLVYEPLSGKHMAPMFAKA